MSPRSTDPTKSTEQSDKLLNGIVEDFEDDETTTSAVTQKLAGIVNKRFSTTLSEEKLKENWANTHGPRTVLSLQFRR